MLVTPYYAAVFGLLFVALSYRIITLRRKYQVSIGDDNHKELIRAIRVHGNFSEYVPFALLLIYFIEVTTDNVLFVHVSCLIFLFARILHAYGVSQVNENIRWRFYGILTTGGVISLSALYILIHGLFGA